MNTVQLNTIGKRVLLMLIPSVLLFGVFKIMFMGNASTRQRFELEEIDRTPANLSTKEKSNRARALAGTFDLVKKVNPEFINLDVTEASKKFVSLLRNNQTKCKNIGRFGRPEKQGDGGYYMCMDESVAPKKNNCLVYSFGIKDEWSFDDGVHDQLGCEVHSFDPSMTANDHKRKNKLFFHKMGLWDRSGTNDLKWKLASLQDIIKMLGHENRDIDYLKIDIEGAEWPVLKSMLVHQSTKNVKQMAFEIHTPKFKGNPMNVSDYGEIYRDMKALDDILGFKLYKRGPVNLCCWRFSALTEKNVLGPQEICCYELFYVNKKYL